MRRSGYRPLRPNKSEREALLEMHAAMYSKPRPEIDNSMPAKTKKPAKATSPEGAFPQVTQFRNRAGEVVTVEEIPNYSETAAYAEGNLLWPDLEQRMFARPDNPADWQSDANMTGRNFAILEMVHMTKKGRQDYGNYFAMQCQDEKGEYFSILSRGKYVNEDLEKLSGIALESGEKEVHGTTRHFDEGERFADPQFPVWVRVEFVDGGNFDGYFLLRPAVKELASAE